MKNFFTHPVFIFAIKLFLASGIVYWLVSSGKLEIKSALQLFKNPTLLLITCSLLISQVLYGAYRWQLLVNVKSKKKIGLLTFFNVTWIGRFLSSAMPGVAAGDLIKIGYIKKADHDLSLKYLLTTIALDRLSGLTGLLIVSGSASLLFYRDLIAVNPSMSKIVALNFLFLVLALLIFTIFLIPKALIKSLQEKIKFESINQFLEGVILFSHHKKILLKTIAISVFAHSVNIFTFHLINLDFYQTALSMRHLVTMFPIGQMAMSFPFSFAGIGVGHLAYEKLFLFLNQTNGATLFNNFWFMVLTINTLGVIPFLGATKNKEQQ